MHGVCVKLFLTLLVVSEVRSASDVAGLARNVLEDWIESFGKIVECMTGGEAGSSLAYNNYGCWCGKGYKPFVENYPRYAVDGIDNACRVHDHCYANAGVVQDSGTGCDPALLPKTADHDAYEFTCENETVTGVTTRYPPGTREYQCILAMFWCDLAMAKTVSQYPRPGLFDNNKCPDGCSYYPVPIDGKNMLGVMEHDHSYGVGTSCKHCNHDGTVTDCTVKCHGMSRNGPSCGKSCVSPGTKEEAPEEDDTWEGPRCFTCHPTGVWAPNCKDMCVFGKYNKVKNIANIGVLNTASCNDTIAYIDMKELTPPS